MKLYSQTDHLRTRFGQIGQFRKFIFTCGQIGIFEKCNKSWVCNIQKSGISTKQQKVNSGG
jgi:hypothetical protein